MPTARQFFLLPLIAALLATPSSLAQGESAVDAAWDDPEPAAKAPASAAAEAPPPRDPAAPSSGPAGKARPLDDARERRAAPSERAAKARAADPKETGGPRAESKPVGEPVAPASGGPLAQTVEVTDAQFEAAFNAWKKVAAGPDAEAASKGLEALLLLKREAQAASLDTLAMATLRLARERLEAGQALQAVSYAQAAVTLAPRLPAAHFGLARVYLRTDAADPGRAIGAVLSGLGALWERTGQARAAIGNLGAVALAALVVTACLGVLLLFVRGVRLFLHDFHHLFPRAAARWQSATLALLLLSLPLVLRWGLLPALVVAALSVCMALGLRERAVAAALVALVGAVPLAAGALAEASRFVGTLAADVAVLEDGGPGAEVAAARLEVRRQEGRALHAELFALGSFQGRRGQAAQAEATLRAAGALEASDARLMTNLGNARLARGDVEGALQLYSEASKAAPDLVQAHYNEAVVREARAQRLPVGEAVRERDRAQQARSRAELLDETLVGRPAAEKNLVNLMVLWAPLPASAWEQLATSEGAGQGVARQVAALVSGEPAPQRALAIGMLGALGILVLGALRKPLSASRACDKCRQAVCRRCDRGLSPASPLCSQCNNAFVRRGVVPPQQRARKQLEIARDRERRNRIAGLLALVVSGAGHLVSGAPLRGILAAYAYLVGLVALVFHQGFLRPALGRLDAGMLLLLPLLPALLVLHLLSVRALKRRQAEES